MKELKITHNENLCLTSQCLNKIDDKKFTNFFSPSEFHSNTRSVALMLGTSQRLESDQPDESKVRQAGN